MMVSFCFPFSSSFTLASLFALLARRSVLGFLSGGGSSRHLHRKRVRKLLHGACSGHACLQFGLLRLSELLLEILDFERQSVDRAVSDGASLGHGVFGADQSRRSHSSSSCSRW